MPLIARPLVAGALLGALACGPGPAVGPPVAVELEGVDPEVARLLDDLAGRARGAPGDGGARGRLGMAYEVNGFPRAAEKCYEEAALLEPREARWPYFDARLRAERGDLDGALAAIEGAVRLAPDYLPARLWAGEWLLAGGRSAEAGEAFAAAARLSPEDSWVRLGSAKAALGNGDTGQAIEILEGLAAERGADPVVLHVLGTALRRAGQDGRAREVLGRADPAPRRAWPDPWSDGKREYLVGFGARLLQADDLIAAGRAADALRILETLHAQRPEEPGVATNLGALLRGAGRFDEALAVLEDAVRRNPGHVLLRLNLAASYERSREPERALAEIDAALALEPDRPDAWLRRGILLSRTGRKEEALVAFDEAARRGGERVEPCLLGGIQAAELARWEDARRRLECAVERDPERLDAWLTLAPVRARLGDRRGATSAIERASKIRPGDPRLAVLSSRVDAILAGSI